MEKLKSELEARGHEVMIPLLREEVPEFGAGRKLSFGQYLEDHGGIESFPVGHVLWDVKESAINEHFRKVEWCDAILVANYDKKGIAGYVGGNTLIEIGLAFYLKKPIYLLKEVSTELTYKQEILAMKPILLNDDISLIPNT